MTLSVLYPDLQGVASWISSFEEAGFDRLVGLGIKHNRLGGAFHPSEDDSRDNVSFNNKTLKIRKDGIYIY